MEVHSGFLNITFAISLFLLLSYKIRSLIRAYLIPYLIQQKQALRRRYAEVIEKKKLVASTTVRVDSQIKNQQTAFVFLEKKIQLWHAYLCRDHTRRVRENERLSMLLQEKREEQSKELTATKLAHDAAQAAFKKAHQELLVLYGGDGGKVLLSRFVTKLTEKHEKRGV